MKNNLIGLIFSKDRAMQLQATIESFFLHCRDNDNISLNVLYTTSSPLNETQYDELKKRFSNVTFIEETDFREQVLDITGTCEYVLFLVDDNLFVKDFYLKDVIRSLDDNHDAVGFSLRLGKNTNYCYTSSSQQALPQFRQIGNGILKYHWPDQQHDFSYPLEVSSSAYRSKEILGLLVQLEFKNPNTLEGQMAVKSKLYNMIRSSLLCFENSVTFCNPVNIVQEVHSGNKYGTINNYTSEELANLFSQGMVINIEKYAGFIPNAAHQETKLYFRKFDNNSHKISVIIPCYNHAHYLPEAVQSIVNQTYKNWECIIVNDQSSDNTAEVAEQLIAKYPTRNIRLINKPNNSGLADTRNVGIETSTGKWILPLDSDDMFERTFMQKAVDIIHKEKNVDIIFANIQEFGASNGEWIPAEYSQQQLMIENVMPYCCLYRKELWRKTGGYDNLLNVIVQPEDWNFWLSCSKHNTVVKRIPEKLFLYRVDPNSMYHKTIKDNRKLAWAFIATCHPDLYPIATLLEAWRVITNCPNEVYDKIVVAADEYPHRSLPFFWLGLIYERNGRIDEAINAYQAAGERASEDDWQSLARLAVLYQDKGETAQARSSLKKVLSIKADSGPAKDILPNAARKNNSTESQTGRQKILFYFDRIGNLNQTSPAGTVIAILNFARALNNNNPNIKIHLTGDLVHYKEKCEFFEITPLPPHGQKEQFLANYDVVFFATHIRFFKGITKPSGQVWILWQHCWHADDPVSLSHTSDFDVVICLSELHRATVRKYGIGDEKIITIPNLIDTDLYSPKGLGRNNHSIMFAGGLHPHKGLHILLDAFRLIRQQIKDAELHIYGDGRMWRGGDDYGNYLKGIKPESVHFHDYVSNKDMPKIYSKHGVLCLPSKLETFPMVIVEAQACGCIPVAHNVGGVAATVIDGETGILYSPNTAEKLAETITNAIRTIDTEPSVQQRAIDFVRNTLSINSAPEYISKLSHRITTAKKIDAARTLLQSNKTDQAKLECEQLLQKDPSNPDVQLLQALITMKQAGEQEANIKITKLLEKFPNHLRALNDCGLTAMKAGDTKKALKYFTDAYKFNSWDKKTITNCVNILKITGKYKDAKTLLLNYLANVGEDAQIIQSLREIENLTTNVNFENNIVSQNALDNRQITHCQSSTTNKPLVSIIMPVYNGSNHIRQAIDSVLAQENPNFELIIIDDGSTDNTKEIIQLYNDERIRYFYKKNKGVSSARNLGINQAKGQYIMPLDADDMMTADFITKHLAEFEKHPDANLIYCDVLLIDYNNNPIKVMNKPEYKDRRYLIRDLLRAGHPIIPFRLGIRRSVFNKIGFYDEDLLVGEDYDMIRRFIKAGLKAHHLPEPLHLRRMHADSLSRNYSAKKAKCHFDVIKRLIDTFAYDELFPDIAWDQIAPQMRQLHAKCLAAGTYITLGQEYVQANATEYSKTAFKKACSELKDCLKMDPENQDLQQLLHKSELIRDRYTSAPQHTISV